MLHSNLQPETRIPRKWRYVAHVATHPAERLTGGGGEGGERERERERGGGRWDPLTLTVSVFSYLSSTWSAVDAGEVEKEALCVSSVAPYVFLGGSRRVMLTQLWPSRAIVENSSPWS